MTIAIVEPQAGGLCIPKCLAVYRLAINEQGDGAHANCIRAGLANTEFCNFSQLCHLCQRKTLNLIVEPCSAFSFTQLYRKIDSILTPIDTKKTDYTCNLSICLIFTLL